MPLQALSHARPCCAPTGGPPGRTVCFPEAQNGPRPGSHPTTPPGKERDGGAGRGRTEKRVRERAWPGPRAGWETSRPRTLGVWLEELILGLTATPTPHPGSPEVQDAQGAWPGARRGLCGRAPVPTTHCGPPAPRLPRVGTCHGACAPEGPGVAPGCVTVTRNKCLEKCTFLRDCFFNRLV